LIKVSASKNGNKMADSASKNHDQAQFCYCRKGDVLMKAKPGSD